MATTKRLEREAYLRIRCLLSLGLWAAKVLLRVGLIVTMTLRVSGNSTTQVEELPLYDDGQTSPAGVVIHMRQVSMSPSKISTQSRPRPRRR